MAVLREYSLFASVMLLNIPSKKPYLKITLKCGRLRTLSLFPNPGRLACNNESTQAPNMLCFVGHAVSDEVDMLN